MPFGAIGYASRGMSSHSRSGSHGSYTVKTYPKDEYVKLHYKELYDEYTRLITACDNNDENTAYQILNSNTAIYLDYNSFLPSSGNTAFILACMNKMTNIINMFININKIINNTNGFQYSRFIINKQNNDGLNGLMYICIYGLVEPLKNILTCTDLKINLQDKNGSTAIMFACVANNEECIKTLLLYDGINIKLKETINDKKDMFDYINPDTLLALKDLIIPLYNNFYNKKIININYYKNSSLNKNFLSRKINNIKNSIKNVDNKISNRLNNLLPNLNNKIKLKKNNLIVRANSVKLKQYYMPPKELKNTYTTSKQILIDKINEILNKIANIPESNNNKVEMIRLIYNISLYHSIKDIKTKIEKEHKNIVKDLIPGWF